MTHRADIDEATRVIPSGKVYARPFGEEMVLLDFAKGEYFGLDAVGGLVWRGIVDGRTVGSIASEVSREYDVSREQALVDITRLIADLESQSLVDRSG